MKYRDHSLRYVKRPPPTKQERALSTEPPEQPEEESHIIRTNTDEPLINVNDTPSRIDGLKEAVVAISTEIAGAVVPKAKHHATKALYRTRRVAISAAKKSPVSARRLHPSKSNYKKVLIIMLIFTGGFFVAQKLSPEQESPAALTIDQKVGNQGPIGGTTPNYDTVLPEGKTIESLGGWTRVSPPDRNPVFAYVDTVERVKVTVSQQPLPADFSSNPDKDVKDLALDFNAKERDVADDATVFFIGTSTKGPQSVILAKGKTLILIKSPVQIKNDVWSTYIANLQ